MSEPLIRRRSLPDSLRYLAGKLDEPLSDAERAAIALTLTSLADEAERPTPLAEALESLATLLATNSRDWGARWDDAWLWAILCGWDCEKVEHTDTCTHGAMEEMVAKFGWGAETVAKLRRYREAVRAASAGSVRPDEEPT
jgi:hypothetical protein